MAPEATSRAATAIPNSDRRGSDVPLMLPILLTTCAPDRRFNGLVSEWRLWYAGSGGGVGLLQSGEVEFGHGEHGPQRRGHRVLVRIGDQVEDRRRDDLPGQPVPVGQPAAGDLTAAVGQAVPGVVDLGLVRAPD